VTPVTDFRDAIVRRLREENDELRERVRQLEELFYGGDEFTPPEWGLTAQEQILFWLLVRRRHVTRDQAMTALYSDRADCDVDPKVVDVFVCKMRAKLGRHGISIATHWGRGFELDAATRARFRRPLPAAQRRA